MMNKTSNTKQYSVFHSNLTSHLSPLTITTLGLITLTAFLFTTLATSTYAYNTDTVDEIIITVPAACTFSSAGGSYNINMNAGSVATTNGTTVTTACNDLNGYAVYAIGFSGDSYDSATHTDLIHSTDTANNIKTDGSGSNWKMSLTNPTNITVQNGYGSYSNVPSTYTKVADYTSSSIQNGSFTTSYQVTTAVNHPAGSYFGKVKYTLIHPATAETPTTPRTSESGKICYYPNGSSVVGTMGCQTIPTSGTTDGVSPTSATLLASNFSREGYGFAGWNTAFDYSGTFYGPNETISYTSGQYSSSNPGLSLYAVWVKSVGSLQDSSKVAQLCGTGSGSLTQSGPSVTPTLASVSALTDQRDNQTYAIAKLADGKCWMIENLRLADKDSNNNDIILSSANTNNPSLPLTNVYDTGSTSNHLSPTSNNWCLTSNAACEDQSKIRTNNTTNRAANNPNVNSGSMYSYGNYYNWYSATAGNGTYSTSRSNTSGDICPFGWILPTSGSTNDDFGLLSISLGGNGTNQSNEALSNRFRQFPNNNIYAGLFGNATNKGSDGYYWSRTANDNNYYAYTLHISNSQVHPSYYYGGYGASDKAHKYHGFSVRCLAQ